MEVDTDLLIETKLESTAAVLRNSLREARIKDLNSINVEEKQNSLKFER